MDAYSPTKNLVIDLCLFTCGHTKLGSSLDVRDSFTSQLRSSDVYEAKQDGLEIGTKNNVLDYVFISISTYKGTFTFNGANILLDSNTTPARIRSTFGEPYWIDDDELNEEIIFFYEFGRGNIELQFEFPGKRHLGFIILTRTGVLRDAEQRHLYGVTKEWPPTSD